MKKAIQLGNYLLSKEREQRLKRTKSKTPYKERAKEVYHADICNAGLN